MKAFAGSRILEARHVDGSGPVVLRQADDCYLVEWYDPWQEEHKALRSESEIESHLNFKRVVEGLEEGLRGDRS